MLKKIFVLFIFTLNLLFSQGTKIVKYGNEFLSIGVGGKQLGMGSAATAIVKDVTAGFWNPSALAFVDYPEFILQHDERFGDLINFDYGSVAYPYDKDITFGLSVIRLGIDGIPDTRNALIDYDGNGILDKSDRIDYGKVTYHNAADWGFFLSFAKKHTDDFAYGANVKFIYRSLMENSAFGIGFDVAAIYSPFSNFLLGMNLQDITTTFLSWDTGTKELIPPTSKIGAGYQINIFNGVLTPAVDLDLRFESRESSAWFNVGPVSGDLHFGLDFCYKNFISLRAGYNDIKQLTFGVGLKFSKLNIDYAFAKFNAENDLGNTHRISLQFTLENDIYKRKSDQVK